MGKPSAAVTIPTWEDSVTERLPVTDLSTVDAALGAAVAEISRMPKSRARERLQTLSSILRRVVATWSLTPPSPSQRSFVLHQAADLLLEAKHLRQSQPSDAIKGQRLATWFVNKTR